ncbi:hypothetical protein Tco_0025123 [Tanacetum coccineum]
MTGVNWAARGEVGSCDVWAGVVVAGVVWAGIVSVGMGLDSGGTPPLLPIPLPTPSPLLLLPSTVCRAGVFEVILSPRKRLCIALGSRYEIRQDPKRECMEDFVTTVRQDTYEIYGRLDDAQDRLLMSGRLNMLYKVRRAHARTALLMERAARLSRKAWVQSMDASDTARSEVRALRTTVLAQQTEIAALRAADCARQA